ncbi:MAG: hypothetical protein H7X89_11660 [Rhizobiales bacterium]|nr:hypothetical protein [Hyphomicrobiales bacterium]
MIPARRAGILAVLFLTSGACVSAKAQSGDTILLGEFQHWAAYTFKAPDSKVCYISSRPRASEPKTAKRGEAYFLVTHMPGRKPPIRAEVSTQIGYPFKMDAGVKLTVENESFELYPNEEFAWADSVSDKKIVAAMKNGKTLTVKGTSWRGTETLDTYSLEGMPAALAKIDEACK